jgi:hypothetical protein
LISKAVSTTSRAMREGEIEGYDYYFMKREDVQNMYNNGQLMQFIDFNNTIYGYENSEFDNIDEIIILMGSSGSGKDTVLKNILYKENEIDGFKNKNIKFVISIPSTAYIFKNFIENIGGKAHLIYFDVDPVTRFKRVVTGDLKKSTELSKTIGVNLEEYNVYLDVDTDYNSKINIESTTDKNRIKDLQLNPIVKEIILNAKNRVLRDGDKFDVEISDLEKVYPNEINKIDVSKIEINDVIDKLITIYKNN